MSSIDTKIPIITTRDKLYPGMNFQSMSHIQDLCKPFADLAYKISLTRTVYFTTYLDLLNVKGPIKNTLKVIRPTVFLAETYEGNSITIRPN